MRTSAAPVTCSVPSGPGAACAVTLTGCVWPPNASVPAAQMECGNGTMNEHMLKALKAKDAPTIEFRLSGYDVAKGAAGVQGNLNGTLTLGGVQRPVSIPAKAADAGAQGLHVTGTYTVSMTEFGLKPPSLMMGTMKVDPNVDVSFDLYLKN